MKQVACPRGRHCDYGWNGSQHSIQRASSPAESEFSVPSALACAFVPRFGLAYLVREHQRADDEKRRCPGRREKWSEPTS
jgi:hypothetical protein